MPQPCQAMLGLSGWRMSPGTPEGGLSMRRTARESVDLGRRRIETERDQNQRDHEEQYQPLKLHRTFGKVCHSLSPAKVWLTKI